MRGNGDKKITDKGGSPERVKTIVENIVEHF